MKTSLNPLKTVGTACIAAGLISTWDVCPAQASQTFTGEITPTQDLSDVYFLFSVGACSAPNCEVYAKKISDFLPANTTTPFNITLTSAPDNDPGQYYGYTIMALYDTVNGGVTLGFNQNQAANVLAISPAPEWVDTSLPAWFDGWGLLYVSDGFGATEANTAAALGSGVYNGISMDDARINGPLDPHDPQFTGFQGNLSLSDFTLIDFSGAANGGSGFVVQVVPEPASFSLLASGAILFYFGRFFRRRTKG